MSLAEQYEQNEQYERAYEEYKKQYERESGNVHILEKLAHLASILDKKEEAEKYYKNIVVLDDKNVIAYEKLMDISYENNDKFTYYLARGQMHVLQKQFEHAINDLKKAVSQGADDKKLTAARYMLAELYEKAEKYNQAIDEYLKISDTKEVTSETYLRLAALYDKTGFIESAAEVLQKAKNDGFQELDEDLAHYYFKLGNSQKALELTSNNMLKIRCFMELGKKPEALELLTKISREYGKDPEYCILSAQYYFETNESDKALDKVDEYAKICPNSPLIYQMRALIYEKKEDDFNAHVNWAKYHNLKGDSDIALNEYITAHRINENNIEIITTIADILDKADKNRSIEFYEKLLRLQPNSKRALQKLAEFRESIGDYAEMIMYLDKLKQIDPRNSYVTENYERAKQLSANPPGIFDGIIRLFKK